MADSQTPRPRKTTKCKACPTRYVAGKNGGTGYCSRCLQARRRNQTPGPRRRQPRGRAKVGIWTSVLPELYALITPDVLERFNVADERELLELSLATALERPDLVASKALAASAR